MEARNALALDLGSASGRAILGELEDGKLQLTEVARFQHQATPRGQDIVWDTAALMAGIKEGFAGAAQRLGAPVRVAAVDSWGVDYALVDEDGQEVAAPHAYRDPRTSAVKDRFYEQVPEEECFERTGVLPQDINTCLQLRADIELNPEVCARAAYFQFTPDYFAGRLTGQRGWSRAIASTSGLLQAGSLEWDPQMVAATAAPTSWFGPVSPDRTVIGQYGATTVVRAGSHDTACAVHALPVDSGAEATLFISCGSWSLAGVCVPQPVNTPRAYQAGLTNEARTDGATRLLKNMSGMWILQECMRHWEKEGHAYTYREIDEAAALAPPAGFVIDPTAQELMAPGDMPRRLRELAANSHGEAPARCLDNPGAIVRLISESLAIAHAQTIASLEAVTATTSDTIYMVGGGINNRALCQYTADATGKRVLAGPVEASSAGSILAQLETLDLIGPTERIEIIKASFPVREYQPADTERFNLMR